MAAASSSTSVKGFSVDLDLVKAFHVLNKDKKEAYLSMKYSADGKKLVLDEKGPLKKKNDKNKYWDDLAKKLPESEIRLYALQVDYKDSKNAPRNEIVLVYWVPEKANIMLSMEMEGHKQNIQKCLAGIREAVSITKVDDFNVRNIVKDKLKGTLE